MIKTRILAALAIGSLALSPAVAKETRSARSVPPPEQAKGSERSQERLALLFQVAGGTCDAPGNGVKAGHENGQGRGHEIGRGKGHACDPKSPG
jgi:hypothetical protein